MKITKEFMGIIILNLIFSMLIVYFNPYFDIITLFWFVVLNAILYVFLKASANRNRRLIQEKIEEILKLLHLLDIDRDKYEVIDDEFGKLRDEIIKIIIENKVIAKKALDNQQVLREYIEDIAHQIKTPLTGVLLMLDLMSEDLENNKEYISRIRNNINRLHQLVDILLKLASLDSGTINMKKESVTIKGLLEEIINEMENYFINKDFIIPVIGEDFLLVCDRRWTYEAVFNILKNGMEASFKKGVKVFLKETNIYQSIIIEDFGKGMSDEMLKKAYKRFYKENPDSKGYGIGLPMAKSIMERQNGDLIYTKGKLSNTFELRFYK